MILRRILTIILRRILRKFTCNRGSLHSRPMLCWVSNIPSTFNQTLVYRYIGLTTSLMERTLLMSTLTKIFTSSPTSRGGGGLSFLATRCHFTVFIVFTFKYCSGLIWTIWQEVSSLWSSQSAFWSHLPSNHLSLWKTLLKLKFHCCNNLWF